MYVFHLYDVLCKEETISSCVPSITCYLMNDIKVNIKFFISFIIPFFACLIVDNYNAVLLIYLEIGFY